MDAKLSKGYAKRSQAIYQSRFTSESPPPGQCALHTFGPQSEGQAAFLRAEPCLIFSHCVCSGSPISRVGSQAQRGRAGLVRSFAAKADEAVAAADADMDWSALEKLATSDEAKRQVANLRSTFKDEVQKLEALAPEASLAVLLPFTVWCRDLTLATVLTSAALSVYDGHIRKWT